MTTYTFAAPLGLDDMFRHITHEFERPAGTASIILEYKIDPNHPGIGPLPHQVSLSLEGPNGSRGAQHNLPWLDSTRRVISEVWSSPGYTPAPIEPGRWTLSVDIFRLMPPGNTSYSVTVTLSEQAEDGPALPAPRVVPDKRPGWYKRDLHGHTEHSDGRWSVADFLDHARAREWIDWRIKDGQTMTERANAIMEAGHTNDIAYPMAEGHPWCAGCHWQFADVFPGPARLVEIWNGPWDPAKTELGLT